MEVNTALLLGYLPGVVLDTWASLLDHAVAGVLECSLGAVAAWHTCFLADGFNVGAGVVAAALLWHERIFAHCGTTGVLLTV